MPLMQSRVEKRRECSQARRTACRRNWRSAGRTLTWCPPCSCGRISVRGVVCRQSCHVVSCRSVSCRVLSCPVLSYPVTSCHVLSCHTAAEKNIKVPIVQVPLCIRELVLPLGESVKDYGTCGPITPVVSLSVTRRPSRWPLAVAGQHRPLERTGCGFMCGFTKKQNASRHLFKRVPVVGVPHNFLPAWDFCDICFLS